MTRMTRSKKIDVAEDETADQMAIEDKISQDYHPVLSENTVTTNTLSTTSMDPLTAELNGLKAAFRNAIGVTKKGRKAKGKKKVDQQNVQLQGGESESLRPGAEDTNNAEQPLPDRANPSIQDSKEDIDQTKGRAPSPPVRSTQGRSTKTQSATLAGKDLKKTTRSRKKTMDEAKDALALSAQEDLSSVDSMPICLALEHLKQPCEGSETEESRAPMPNTPARSLDDIENTHGRTNLIEPVEATDDSFLEQITSRSPAKRVSRIEDSVEALDQLEEALEAIDKAALGDKLISPEQETNPKRPATISKPIQDASEKLRNSTARSEKAKVSATVRLKSAPHQVILPQRAQSLRVKSISTNKSASEERKSGGAHQKAPIKRPTSLLPPKQAKRSVKPATCPAFDLPGEAVARRLKEQREARLMHRGTSQVNSQTTPLTSAPSIKSTKPPTRPIFELPGEALSRRKREAHEARIKAQEEEDRKRREFKARPMHKTAQPNTLPRDTTTSRARQSKIGVGGVEKGNLHVSKQRDSNIGAHRSSIQRINLANKSAPRAPGPQPSTTRKSLTNSTIATVGSRTVSDKDVQIQRQRAKEIYDRDAKQVETLERQRKEREAAAKRSREDAAERGRQASREWAEKQRAKKMTINRDKGVNAESGTSGHGVPESKV